MVTFLQFYININNLYNHFNQNQFKNYNEYKYKHPLNYIYNYPKPYSLINNQNNCFYNHLIYNLTQLI